jgi:hypothetical protein
MFEKVWLWIDRLSMVAGLITFIISMLTLATVYRLRRRQMLDAKAVTNQDGALPGVLVVNVGNQPIEPTVRRFVAEQDWARSKDVPFVAVNWERELTPDQVDEFLDKVREARAALLRQGCNSLHLFIKVPLVVATMIGAEFGNGIPTVLYHMDSRKGYGSWGLLYRRVAL